MAVTTRLHCWSFSGLCAQQSRLRYPQGMRDGPSNVTFFPSEPISVTDYADYLLY